MSGQHTPMAQVSEDDVFFLCKQPDGSRWPVGTKLYAESPLITTAHELLVALRVARENIVWWESEHSCCRGAEVQALTIIDAAISKATASTTDAGVAG